MLGLIKKDFLLMKENWKTIALLILVFSVLSFDGKNTIYIIPVFISVMVFMTTFSYDEYNHWDAYVCSFAHGRKQVVCAKYIASFLFMIASLLLTCLIAILIRFYNPDFDISSIHTIMLGLCFCIVLIESISYPFIFKFGAEKGRILLFVFTILFVVVANLFSHYVDVSLFQNWFSLIKHYYFVLGPVGILILLFGSYQVSKRIYLKKEF